MKTTDQIFQYLAREKQGSIQRFIRYNIFARISSFWKDKSFTPVKVTGDTLQIIFKDNLAKEQFLEWLEDARCTNFTDEKVDEKQMLLSLPETPASATIKPPAPN